MKPFNKNIKIYFLIGYFGISNLLWLLAKASQGTPLYPEFTPIYVSQLSAINGAMMMSLNFILAGRIKLFERIFGGLDKVYKFHKKIGKYAFALLWFHPLFLILDNFLGLKTILRYLWFGETMAYNFGLAALYLMTILIILTVAIKLPYHIWKHTHRLMVLALIFAAAHINTAFSDTTYFLPLKIWLLAFASFGIFMWFYTEIIFGRFGKHIHTYKVSKLNIKGSIAELIFENVKNPITYIGGQFVLMSFKNNKRIPAEFHPYTISSGPNEDLRISAKDLGNYSTKLFSAQPGDEVKIIGPYGFFTYESLKEHKNQIWIAGGIGVTPFLSILTDMIEKNADNDISFIYSVKSPEEAVYLQEIKYKISNLKNGKLIEHYSDQAGFLNAVVIAKMTGKNLPSATILMCGPAVMTAKLKQNFKDAGIPQERVIFEDFDFK